MTEMLSSFDHCQDDGRGFSENHQDKGGNRQFGLEAFDRTPHDVRWEFCVFRGSYRVAVENDAGY